jgi:hypothetical protein
MAALPLYSDDVQRTPAVGVDRRQGVRGVCVWLLEKEKGRQGKERQRQAHLTFIVAQWGVEEGAGGEGGHTAAGGGGGGPRTALSGRPWPRASGHMPDRKQGRTGSLMCGPGSHSVGWHQIQFEIKFQMNSNLFKL